MTSPQQPIAAKAASSAVPAVSPASPPVAAKTAPAAPPRPVASSKPPLPKRSFAKKTPSECFLRTEKHLFKNADYYYLLFIPILALFLFANFLAYQKLKALGKDLEIKKAEQIALEEWNSSIAFLDTKLKNLAPEIALIKNSLPNEEGIIDFIENFDRIAQGVAIKTFRFKNDQPLQNKDGHSYISFVFEVQGEFALLNDFLKKFTGLPYLLKIDTLEVNREGDSADLIVLGKIFVSASFFTQK